MFYIKAIYYFKGVRKLKFVHLHVHSSYSLLNSTLHIEDLVKAAAQQGHTALAITDDNVMYGAVAFYKACKRHNIKPIIGLSLLVESEADAEGKRASYPLILLAQTNMGYRHLLKLSTLVQTEYKNGVPFAVLNSYSKDLVAISPSLGEINQQLLHENFETVLKLLEKYTALFRHNFYMAIEPSFSKHEQLLNSLVIQFCREKSIQSVIANPIHYLQKEDAIIHECLQCIKNGTRLTETDKSFEGKQYFLKDEETMVKEFQHLPEAIQNTVKIASQCNITIDLGNMVLPKFPLPQGITADQYLKGLCKRGLEKRYKSNLPSGAYERLEYELTVIQKMHFSDYFLIVWDFMSYAHKHKILTGPGRGSAAGSLVAYVLGITNIDPLKYNLLFERFLNPERISMPDIDIDFPDHRRDEMIQYVSSKYGKEHVAQIVTFGTLGARVSIRDVGRVLGVQSTEIDRLAKIIPSRPGISLEQALKQSIPLQKELQENNEARKVFTIALKIEGLPRHTSTHAAGVVISDSPLSDLVPLQEGHDGVMLTQYPMDILEELGLLKMDFLGLRNLSLIENIQQFIKKEVGQPVNLHEIPLDDEKTFTLLGEGDTTGVFQLESAGMRKVLRRLKPTNLEDIVAVNALYRPGPMENIPIFIERKHGHKKITFPHRDLKEILEPTYGVIVYQEQIMQIASKMAGFTLGEADLLRRAVSKKKREILEKERGHFVNGCLQKGYDEETAEQVYDLIVRFANYGFNRSHAVAYSVIAYWLAYLKANFPLYFTAALLSSVAQNEDKIAQYIGEAKQKQMIILPPSINRSSYNFQVEDGKIRFSLVPIKNVGFTALKEILYHREKKGFYKDLFDFCARVSLRIINRRVVESLILSGSFDEFGKDRAVLLASLDAAIDYAELVNEDDSGFFLSDDIVPKPQYVNIEPLSTQDKLQMEKEVLGFYLSNHPIEPYNDLLKKTKAIKVANLQTEVGAPVHMGALIVDQRTIKTKKGDQMAFLTLSDDTGELDAVVFPLTFKKLNNLLKKGEILFIQGKIEEREGKLQLIIDEATSIKDLKANAFDKLYLKVDKSQQESGKLHQIKNILKQYPGTTEVYIHYADEQKTVLLPKEWSAKLSKECLKKLKLVLGAKNVVIRK
ncbi:DNA-directed DNA polymerase III PolC [Schinkia azotoformans MEV2011]|uniref:DNA polymerase III subunit alpha n=1 Tax=Schinkia azotoformans MEV2011 TaxID=1348973 RepID=A0A072NRR6_SCHAZ|nr:DNA-directed DNA polymerase III PolC [Schinkia azotoformans MEV2011]